MKKTFLLGVVVGALALNTFGLFASVGDKVEAATPNTSITQQEERSTGDLEDKETQNNFYNRCGTECPKEEPCVGDCSTDPECVESGCMGEGCGVGNGNYNCNIEEGQGQREQSNGYRNGQMRRRGC